MSSEEGTHTAHPNVDMYDFKSIDDAPVQSFVRVQDYEEIVDTLSSVPQSFRRDLLDKFERIYSEYQYDQSVTESEARKAALDYFLNIRVYVKDKHFLNQTDQGLRKKAKRYARYSARLIGKNDYAAGCLFAEKRGVSVHYENWTGIVAEYQIAMEGYAAALTLGDHDPYQYVREISVHKRRLASIKVRLMDEDWWTRRLILNNDREFERAAIHWGRVRKNKQIYVSNETLEKVKERRARSLAIMDKLVVVSDQDDRIDMMDILKGSVANPRVRMAELMNRIYGFEQYAKENGHIGEFYTFTAPSKYHANSSKYQGSTPREVQQQYFSPMWARIRAKLHKEGFTVYGFRIAESHKDGCTHWHVLLFMPKSQVVKVSNILVDYAFREDGTEKGAYLRRFDWEEIDPKQGSAIGYIIKYISKNIAGFNVGSGDEDGEPNKKGEGNQPSHDESAQRVGAWASVWGVRQFQQIGGSSVSVWRELRRLGDDVQEDQTIEAARQAANKGDWKAYLEVQDGINLPLKNQPIQLYSHSRVDKETGEEQLNKYGEVVDYIQGLQTKDAKVKTRLKRWFIEEKETEDVAERDKLLANVSLESPEDAMKRLLTPENGFYPDDIDLSNLKDFWEENDVLDLPKVSNDFQILDAATALAFDLPWSSVNNCRNPQIENPRNDFKFIKAIEKAYQNHVNSGKKVSISQFDFVKSVLKI